MIQSRMLWMLRPVDRSITVSAPQRIDHTSFSTSSATEDVTALIADVGVDLHQEVAADDHRLQLGMVDVGRDDGAAARDLGAHELRRDEGRELGAEALAVGERHGGAFERLLTPEVLAVGDVDHLFGDDAGLGELVLRDELVGAGLERRRHRRASRHQLVGADVAVVLGAHGAAVVGLVAAAGEPGAGVRQAGGKVHGVAGLGVGTGGVVDANRRLLGRGIERDLAERHGNLRRALDTVVDLGRPGQRPGGDALRHHRVGLGLIIHVRSPFGRARRLALPGHPQRPVPALALPRFRFEGYDLSRVARRSTPVARRRR